MGLMILCPHSRLEPKPSEEKIERLGKGLLTAGSWDISSMEQLTSDDETQPVFACLAEDEAELEEGNDDSDAENELPDLDEEETSTFGRLSWVDVRSQVSRTRRPPPSCTTDPK